MQVQKFGGLSPKKIGGKNMQNLEWFYLTSGFDLKYIQNETRYPKSERHVIENDSSRVRRNKSGELEFGHTQIDFFERLYFGS